MWVRRSAVVLCAAALAFVSIAGTAAAGEDYENVHWQGTLVTEVPDTAPYRQCYIWSECQELRGVAIEDIDVSGVTEGYDEAGFNLYDPSVSGLITTWHLCMYEEQGDQMEWLGCESNLHIWSKKGGELDADTDAVRLIVEQGTTSEYWFEVIAW